MCIEFSCARLYIFPLLCTSLSFHVITVFCLLCDAVVDSLDDMKLYFRVSKINTVN